MRASESSTRREEDHMQDRELEERVKRALEESRITRRSLLRRSVVFGAGLTALPAIAAACGGDETSTSGATGTGGGAPVGSRVGRRHLHGRPRRGRQGGRDAEHDRAPARLGELRRDHGHLPVQVRHQDQQRQPERLVGRGEPGRQVPQGPGSRSGCSRRRAVLRRGWQDRRSLCDLQELAVGHDPGRPQGRGRRLGG